MGFAEQDATGKIDRLEKRIERERRARQDAEFLLEAKSLELYELNQHLVRLASDLEESVAHRTRELVHERERALRLAERDQLTGLANRMLFTREMERALSNARERDEPVGLLLIDIDRFKDINDTLGHDAGDAFLQHAGSRIDSCIRKGDTVARLGGDEFAVLCPAAMGRCETERVADRILAALRAPTSFRDRNVFATCSIGVAMYPADADNAVDLQRFADMALYKSKTSGRGVWTAFDEGMWAEIEERCLIEGELRRAARSGEIEAWFQPIINVGEARMQSAEALVRWRHPTRGLLMPDSFIPIAEGSQLIEDVGHAVWRSACASAAPWIADGRLRSLSVNVSATELKNPLMIDNIVSAVRLANIPLTAITVEITEQTLIDDLDIARARLEKLAEYGIRIALDDFGTGYSNIGYLRRLPIHVLKIDRTLTADVATDSSAAAIVRAVVDIANALDMEPVAEGVETEAQALHLSRCGCRSMQGYLFGKPLEKTEFESRLEAQGFGQDLLTLSGNSAAGRRQSPPSDRRRSNQIRVPALSRAIN